jgi:hypothetical protein
MRHVDLELCKKLKLCNQCSKYLGINHVCVDQRWCKNCKVAVPMDHMCYILTQQERDKNKSDPKFNGYVFFDYECMNQEGLHIPNLIVAQKLCLECLNDWKILEYDQKSTKCENTDCGVNRFYKNETFCRWLLKQEHFICLAHNMKGYDGIFIMNYLARNPLPTDKYNAIMNQGTIQVITANKIKIIDSINFIALSIISIRCRGNEKRIFPSQIQYSRKSKLHW